MVPDRIWALFIEIQGLRRRRHIFRMYVGEAPGKVSRRPSLISTTFQFHLALRQLYEL